MSSPERQWARQMARYRWHKRIFQWLSRREWKHLNAMEDCDKKLTALRDEIVGGSHD